MNVEITQVMQRITADAGSTLLQCQWFLWRWPNAFSMWGCWLGCSQISQVFTHHSCNQVSALVKDQRTYWSTSFSFSLLKFLGPTTSQPVLSSCIFLNWSLFSLLAVLDPRLLSPYPDHLLLISPNYKPFFFNMQHPAFGINSLTLSMSRPHPHPLLFGVWWGRYCPKYFCQSGPWIVSK